MLIRRIARPLLASIFIAGGLDAARNPGGKAEAAENVGASKIAGQVGLRDAEQLVRVNGIAQVLGGLALATNRFPRLAALGLVASLAPTTLAGHRFWEQDDDAGKAQQRVHFLKNLSVIGGLLLAAVDTEGRESVGHRVRRRSSKVASAIPSAGDVADALPTR